MENISALLAICAGSYVVSFVSIESVLYLAPAINTLYVISCYGWPCLQEFSPHHLLIDVVYKMFLEKLISLQYLPCLSAILWKTNLIAHSMDDKMC